MTETPELAPVASPAAERPNYLPGIKLVSNDEYHASPGVSKTGLWTIHTKTPAHFMYGERKDSNAFSMGEAVHTAILEPHEFETRCMRGPADRRGNKWKDAEAHAAHIGMTLLTEADYDAALLIRDAAHAHPIVQKITSGAMVETAGYAIDEQTGVLVKCKPDLYHPGLALIGDLKSSVDGSADAFAKSIINYGYHFQEAMYSDVWQAAGGGEVAGFIFIVVEKTAPFLVSVFELEPRVVTAGHDAYRAALNKYADCEHGDVWPGYPETVQRLDAPEWFYRQQEFN